MNEPVFARNISRTWKKKRKIQEKSFVKKCKKRIHFRGASKKNILPVVICYSMLQSAMKRISRLTGCIHQESFQNNFERTTNSSNLNSEKSLYVILSSSLFSLRRLDSPRRLFLVNARFQLRKSRTPKRRSIHKLHLENHARPTSYSTALKNKNSTNQRYRASGVSRRTNKKPTLPLLFTHLLLHLQTKLKKKKRKKQTRKEETRNEGGLDSFEGSKWRWHRLVLFFRVFALILEVQGSLGSTRWILLRSHRPP